MTKPTKRFKFTKETKKAHRKSMKTKSLTVPKWSSRLRTGFPQQLRMTHRYCESLIMISSLGALVTQFFRCNGMFDPNQTGTGHQPMYFDQLAAIYNHFTVFNSKITFQITPQTTVSTAPAAIVGVYIEDDGTATPGAIEGFMEQGTASYRQLAAYPTGGGPVTVSKSWNAERAFGRTPESDPNLQGTASSDPTEQQSYCVFIGSQFGSTGNVNWALSVTVEYDAVWQELKPIVSS